MRTSFEDEVTRLEEELAPLSEYPIDSAVEALLRMLVRAWFWTQSWPWEHAHSLSAKAGGWALSRRFREMATAELEKRNKS